MTTNKVSYESPFYFQLIHVNNIWNIKTVFMQNGYRLQWYGIFSTILNPISGAAGVAITSEFFLNYIYGQRVDGLVICLNIHQLL